MISADEAARAVGLGLIISFSLCIGFGVILGWVIGLITGANK